MNDQAAFLTSIFGDMPGWSPNNVVDPSGTCATTKLMQCRNFGVYECEVSAKFERGPENLQDLSKDDFLARKKVVDAVEKWNEQRNKYETYHLILYDYEIVKGSTKRVRDRGHLIFIDLTTSRFLLVMCFGDSSDAHKPNVSYEEDYAKLTKANANRFMSLAKYVYHDGNRPHLYRTRHIHDTQTRSSS
ncbi:unnamed protein product [Somion occarium]|uniref:DUF3885 domain-containing protein n=1 Tax=Somion occarium TaxID=3059160 RepID=A0ABP1DZT7_9APHY